MEDEKPIEDHSGLFLMKSSSIPTLNSFLSIRRNKEQDLFYDRDIHYHRSDKIPITFGKMCKEETELRDRGREMDG